LFLIIDKMTFLWLYCFAHVSLGRGDEDGQAEQRGHEGTKPHQGSGGSRAEDSALRASLGAWQALVEIARR